MDASRRSQFPQGKVAGHGRLSCSDSEGQHKSSDSLLGGGPGKQVEVRQGRPRRIPGMQPKWLSCCVSTESRSPSIDSLVAVENAARDLDKERMMLQTTGSPPARRNRTASAPSSTKKIVRFEDISRSEWSDTDGDIKVKEIMEQQLKSLREELQSSENLVAKLRRDLKTSNFELKKTKVKERSLHEALLHGALIDKRAQQQEQRGLRLARIDRWYNNFPDNGSDRRRVSAEADIRSWRVPQTEEW